MPTPGTRARRQRVVRAARRSRNLALAYWTDGLVRSGEVADLAAVARMCGVSRAGALRIVALLGIPTADQMYLIRPPNPHPPGQDRSSR